MLKENIDIIKRHIKTHTERSADDQAAVSFLKNSLKSGGRINSNFAENDKWPNTDGTFEFVSNPEISRQPTQNFIVQIKGTQLCDEEEGVVKYQLKSLGGCFFSLFLFTGKRYREWEWNARKERVVETNTQSSEQVKYAENKVT